MSDKTYAEIHGLLSLVKVKVTLEQIIKDQRRSRGMGLLFLQPRSYMGFVVNVTLRPLYVRKRNAVLIV